MGGKQNEWRHSHRNIILSTSLSEPLHVEKRKETFKFPICNFYSTTLECINHCHKNKCVQNFLSICITHVYRKET